jgi:hypothetical protein
MPKVIYDKILGDPLLYINIHLQLADQTMCYSEGVFEDAIIQVGQSYVLVDFVVIEIGGDERAPIILAQHSYAPRRPSFMQSTLRLFSPSRTRKRSSCSRTACFTPLHNLRHHTNRKS